jgi:hypothetical protein
VTSREIDTTVSHSTRIRDYSPGGEDDHPVDREAGDRSAALLPGPDAGVRRSLDTGIGLLRAVGRTPWH